MVILKAMATGVGIRMILSMISCVLYGPTFATVKVQDVRPHRSVGGSRQKQTNKAALEESQTSSTSMATTKRKIPGGEHTRVYNDS